jgi:hypothetical protein
MIKSEQLKNEELRESLLNLENELELLDHQLIDHNLIIQQYRLYKEAFNNKIFIENLEFLNIRIKDTIYILNNKGLITLYSGITNKSTIYLLNCNNLTLVVNVKVNHITLENCEDISVKVVGGSISGIDCINCANINFIFDKSDVYFIDISKSSKCNIYIPETIAPNTSIITMYSLFVNLYVLGGDGKISTSFKKNQNYIDTIGRYRFIKNEGPIILVNF